MIYYIYPIVYIWINVHVLTMLYLITYLNCADGFQIDHVIPNLECIENKLKWLCELYNTETMYNFVVFYHNWSRNVSNSNDKL